LPRIALSTDNPIVGVARGGASENETQKEEEDEEEKVKVM
jgi:hypothetical protein